MTNLIMKKIVAGLLCTFLTPISFAETEVNIIYVSKMLEIDPNEENVGGLAELHSLVTNTRQSKKYTLFLHGGDFLGGSLMSSFDKGTHMIDILNIMEPDAVALNEREFAFKEDELSMRIQESAFPFVNSNITDPLTGEGFESVEDSMCYELGDLDICVFGILDPMVVENYPPDRIAVNSSIELIKNRSNVLRMNGADVVILMASHAQDELVQLLKEAAVDLVFYSSSSEDVVIPVGTRLLLKQGTDKGKAITVKISGGINLNPKFDAEVVSLNSYAPDPNLAKKIDYYISKLDSIMGATIGKTSTDITSKRLLVRTEETAIGNLIADALRDYYKADVALVNGGSIRGNTSYPAGTDLIRKDIQRELPFEPKSILFSASGQEILDALENGLSLVESIKGRFLQVSGLKLTWCAGAAVGSRLHSVSINGKPIEAQRKYTVASSEYLYEGGDGYSMFMDNELIRGKKERLVMWELVRAYIEEMGEISPKVEGRIKRECNSR